MATAIEGEDQVNAVAAARDSVTVAGWTILSRVTARLRSAADHWRSIAGVADEDVDRLVMSDRIDVLVDLSGHTAANRLTLFSRKPAPVQATWAGYSGTTGLQTVDYFKAKLALS